MKKIIRIAVCLSAILLLFNRHSYAQSFTKYFDSNWTPVAKEGAFYRTEFVREGDLYRCISYWVGSNKLYGTSAYADTSFTKGVGIRKMYYETGSLKDSMVYGDEGKVISIDEFSENGLQVFHAFYDNKDDDMKADIYDEKGNKKPGFITYQKQAKFPGGSAAWFSYLQSHIKSDIPSRRKAPVGVYTVMVSFIIDKEGKITEVKAINDPGYGMAEEAVRVIEKGPDWIPAVQNNKVVLYRERQPITFQVEGKK